MTRPGDDRRERLEELFIQRALEGLSAAEERELRALAEELGLDPERDDYELAAAALHLASLPELEEPPMRLQLKLQRAVERELARLEGGTAQAAPRRRAVAPPPAAPRATRPPAAPQRPPAARAAAPRHPRAVPAAEPRPRPLWPAWTAAAAALLVAALLLWQDLAPESLPTPTELRAALLREAPDAVLFDWRGTEDPAGVGAGGDVVWSNVRQQGYMRIEGLRPNVATEQQYQLWIFDARRPEATPVDGGVFDVPPGASEVVVPIDAKLEVFEPTLFAVTIEPPGGVVVSERAHIVLAGTLQ